MGDMNASLYRNPPNRQDQQFKQFCNKYGLLLSEGYPIKDTFFHHNGLHCATLDYILTMNGDVTIKNIDVIQQDPLNLSDHSLVKANLILPISKQKTKKTKCDKNESVIHRKRNWDKCNLPLYRKTLQKSRSIPTQNSDCLFDITENLKLVTEALKKAEKKAFPPTKGKRKKKKVKSKWTPELANAVKESKLAHKEWKNANRPIDPNNFYVINRKLAKRKLRKVQRQKVASDRDQLYHNITKAHIEKDKKLFAKIVNKQRNNLTRNTDLIILDGETYESYDNIIEGWELYFTKLSEPKNSPHYDSAFQEKTKYDIQILEELCSKNKIPIELASEDEIE
ncbi:hypothetical protein FSP39_010865 [Pinctada imbricata]|uniref:Endonuclease/exonuclease/phosphatase domain-containing protein n=1 Tax=Pinctada imbricata TaxID=66713 RepID=A0AA89BW74_PINIB|nr:hypothetical protein FSP39_010865 [Pinctada imbricata]